MVLYHTAFLFAYELPAQQDQHCRNTSTKAEENISWITLKFSCGNSHSGFSIASICRAPNPPSSRSTVTMDKGCALTVGGNLTAPTCIYLTGPWVGDRSPLAALSGVLKCIHLESPSISWIRKKTCPHPFPKSPFTFHESWHSRPPWSHLPYSAAIIFHPCKSDIQIQLPIMTQQLTLG